MAIILQKKAADLAMKNETGNVRFGWTFGLSVDEHQLSGLAVVQIES